MNSPVRPLLAAAALLVMGIAPALAQSTIRVALVSDITDEGQNTPVPTADALAAFYGGAAVCLYRRLTGLLRDWKTLSGTLDQLRKDRACLEGTLE